MVTPTPPTPPTWQNTPFYITPRLSSGWALVVAGTEAQGYWITVAPQAESDKRQQWKAEIRPSGFYVLRNQGLAGLVLTGIQISPVSYVTAQSLSPQDAHQTWNIDEKTDGGFKRILCGGFDDNTFMQGQQALKEPSSPLMILGGYQGNKWGDFEVTLLSEAS